MSEILGIIALTVVAPIWIVSHYVTKWRLAKGISTGDAETLEDLWKIAQGMENRIETLESILDENVDGWRSKA
ncbi:MAG: envelope stress response membrane protein PspB [Gammaproteobacteria bacterium]